MSFKLGFSNYIEFYLENKTKGIVRIPEPINWDKDSSSGKRIAKTHGSTFEISSKYEFHGIAATYINDVVDNIGINEDIYVRSIKEGKQFAYGLLDLYSFNQEKGFVKCKFSKTSLSKIIKTKESEQIELERKTSLVDTNIEPLKTNNLLLEGRGLFLRSEFENLKEAGNNYRYNLENRRTDTKGVIISAKHSIPMVILNSSHLEDATNTIPDTSFDGLIQSKSGGGQFVTDLGGSVFFTNSGENRILDIELNINFDISVYRSFLYDSESIYVFLRVHSASDSDIDSYRHNEELFYKIYNNKSELREIRINKILKSFRINEGESISLHIRHDSKLEKNIGSDEWVKSLYEFKESSIVVTELNKTPSKKRKVVQIHDWLERLMELMTGRKDNFYAPIFKTGKWKDVYLNSGLWNRGFYGVEESENDKQKIKTSFKDFKQFCLSKLAVGTTSKIINNKEVISFEDVNDLYSHHVLLNIETLPIEYEESIAEKYLYSSLEFGDKFADKSDDKALYEESFGLSEYNAVSRFSTEYSKKNKVLKMISPYRTDPTGVTFCLKNSIEKQPDKDTKYDSSIFAYHTKKNNIGELVLRKWNDDFYTYPQNVYDRESCYNLLFTPKQMMLRHRTIFNVGLHKSIKFISSTGNSSLLMENKKGDQIDESADVKLSDLGRQRLNPKKIKIKLPYTEALASKINSQINISGKVFKTTQGLWSFKDDKGVVKMGWMLSYKHSKTTDIELIEFNSKSDGFFYEAVL